MPRVAESLYNSCCVQRKGASSQPEPLGVSSCAGTNSAVPSATQIFIHWTYIQLRTLFLGDSVELLFQE